MTSAATAYGELLSREKPEVISRERQNRLYIERLEKFTAKKSVTPAEKKLIALLTVLVEEYEAKHDPLPDAEPTAIIRHLMEAHNLRQKDLLDVFGKRASSPMFCAAGANSPNNISGGRAPGFMCRRRCLSGNIWSEK
jgi:HTH-type transcriptional regulator/antitoxin HigA